MAEYFSRFVGRAALAALATLVFLAPGALAQAPRIERIDVLEAAIYEIDVMDLRPGQQGDPRNVKIVEKTDVVPAKVGLQFGIRYVVVGEPAGASVRLNVVTRFPPQGLRDPVFARTHHRSDRVVTAKFGEPLVSGYKFDQTWEAVPGIWTIEIWDGGRKLVEQRFKVVRER